MLEKCIIRGIRSERDAKIFKQILYCDDFLTFKKIMVSKNKELEVEAMKKIHEGSKAGIIEVYVGTAEANEI